MIEYDRIDTEYDRQLCSRWHDNIFIDSLAVKNNNSGNSSLPSYREIYKQQD